MNQTIDNKRIIRGNELQEIQTYVGLSHAVHMYIRVITEIFNTLGTGVLMDCPTDKMLVDFFTNPLQGSKFNLFRSLIMGTDNVATLWNDSDDKYKVLSASKKHVEDTVNNIYVDDGHTEGHAYNVNYGHIYWHTYART